MAADLTEPSLQHPSTLPLAEDNFIGGRIQAWEPQSSPYIGGGYSSAKAGKSTNYPSVLAKSLNSNIFFAGEATNIHAGGCAHSALDTGYRAANEVNDYLKIFNANE